ncbi:MAG: hypothetical protein EP330_07605 [Deltaproteobacteria bacterium]|nr:MAG: hypothetical protein EP330_07605 [Deltaproteobacteria bacterium]
MTRLALSAVALLALSPAFAFTGDKVVGLGVEPGRVMTTSPEAQGALYASPAWKAFTAGEGQGWLARFDEATGTPHRMWGPGLPVDASSADRVTADIEDFLARNGDLHGDAELVLKSANYVERLDSWYVDYDVLVEGLPVWRGGVTARVKHGSLVMLGLDTYPRTLLQGELVLGAEEAQKIAVTQGPAPHAMHAADGARLVWLPVEVAGGVVLRMAWEVRSETFKPVGQWVSFVDAASGELINVHNEVRFAGIEAEHDLRTVNGETAISPLPYLAIGGGMADEAGQFSGGGTIDGLRGTWFNVRNNAGPNANFEVSGDHLVTDSDATMAEIDTYVFAHQIREWGLANAPEVGLMSERSFTVNVNMDDVCNAYYDGQSINFFQAGQGCNNSGRIADVVYHEWGHGFHDYSLQAGVFDGSVSEGVGDIVSFLQTDDHIMAPYFMTDGSGIRQVERDRVYPDDVVGEVHEDGLIFGGAVWDMWKIARAEYGEEVGTQITTDVFTGLIKGGPTLGTVYDEAVFADDDDGDLSNGTPNQCLIIDGFLPHGLGPAGGSSVMIPVHEPLAMLEPDMPNRVSTELVNLAPTCVAGTPTGGSLYFRVDGGDWQAVDADIAVSTVSAELPALPAGAYVEYYLDVETDDAGRTTLPSGGVINPFVAYVGGVLEVYCNNFEGDDGGFGHQLISGDQVEGADDWQWGEPGGLSGDPSAAYSGRNVWGNDLGNGEYNGAYQADRVNQLFTPALDTRHYLGSFLQYRRWLNVEDGTYDKALIKADGEVVWNNWSSTPGDEHHQDAMWAPHAVELGTAGDDGEVTLAWEIQSDAGLDFGGWNIDDVCIYAPDTPDNRLGISDFAANAADGRVIELTWTNPVHAPVEELVVVRKAGEYPTSHDDGKVVFRSDELTLGALMRFEDKARKGVDFHYAVYASDGTNWLSWTRPGFNADVGIAGGEGAGCGCNSNPAPAAGWLGLGLLGLVVRRRRK